MAVIKVPKTPKKAYNENRRPSALLLSQIEHLEWASRPASQRKPDQLRKPKVRTEREAAERIAELTQKVLAAKDATARTPPAEPPEPTGVSVSVGSSGKIALYDGYYGTGAPCA